MTSIDAGIAVEVISDVPVVTAPEEIDVTNAARLRTALLQAAAYGTGTLVIDMSRTRFCDCAGLHAVVAAHKRAHAERGEVRLVISGPGALRVFAITGIDRVIPHFTSLDEALRMGSQIATLPAAAGELRMQPDSQDTALGRQVSPCGQRRTTSLTGFAQEPNVYPAIDDQTHRCEIRVLDVDPHAEAIPGPGPSPMPSQASATSRRSETVS